ncbi:retrotransposon protein [Cucumis melo var. makuwa]|uniref:Retrotransposon protein n=2 Tax=Cucumis melo TaxID=3656 RepID=A0A5A7T1B0_CUCMM|nr:retrotransposon protein [Cucumis melo var. makuwa]TYK13924.1 retrotransposon protein [Cucumis melo var. makuwa]
MRGPMYSGFRWKDEAKCIIAEKELFDLQRTSQPTAKGLLNKPFLYYDELAYVFERDRVASRFSKMFTNIGSNDLVGYEGFDMPNGNDMEFLSMYSQGIYMSQDDVCASRSSRASDARPRLSSSKRKRGSQRENKIEMIHMIPECVNDQLRTIVE